MGFALSRLHRQAFGVARTAEFAAAVEDAGADSLWMGDRNLAAADQVVGYGGRGTTVPEELNPAAGPFVLLGVAASASGFSGRKLWRETR